MQPRTVTTRRTRARRKRVAYWPTRWSWPARLVARYIPSMKGFGSGADVAHMLYCISKGISAPPVVCESNSLAAPCTWATSQPHANAGKTLCLKQPSAQNRRKKMPTTGRAGAAHDQCPWMHAHYTTHHPQQPCYLATLACCWVAHPLPCPLGVSHALAPEGAGASLAHPSPPGIHFLASVCKPSRMQPPGGPPTSPPCPPSR
jgi:hypothetical protein